MINVRSVSSECVFCVSVLVNTQISVTSGVCGAREMFMSFKRSLSGGQGDVILSLWMDIERLKTLNTRMKNRFTNITVVFHHMTVNITLESLMTAS